ncbi:MAG: aspartate-semialdehyde dehydrogenase [Planctomycetota bacterium]
MRSEPLDRARPIAVLGATGAVGNELLAILADHGIDSSRVTAYASARSTGQLLHMGPSHLRVAEIDTFRPQADQLVFLAVDSSAARRFAEVAVGAGARVIDLSAAHREDPDVPLVVPQINGHLLDEDPRLVASPNCCAAILVTALAPLVHVAESNGSRITELRVATYQSVSGAGRAGIEELLESTRAALVAADFQPAVFPVSCAFNVFPHESTLDPESGRNGEEDKLLRETQKLLAEPIPMETTCVRVPVLRVHALAVSVELSQPVELAKLENAFRTDPSIRFRSAAERPFAASDAAGRDHVLVSRLRPSSLRTRGPSAAALSPSTGSDAWQLWVLGDQLRKGAALNAIEIALAGGWLH